MTKAQLSARVAELEAQQQPKLPVHIAAHEAGAAARAKAVAAGRATARGVRVTTAVVSGFLQGLMGR